MRLDALVRRLAPTFEDLPPGPLGVALSGGGDSVALLAVLNHWGGRPLHAFIVDHGLRAESAAEARAAADFAATLAIQAEVLSAPDWNVEGNLQAEARRLRRRLIAEAAKKNAIPTIALGHTADDVAETFLMRLARGSGLYGLSAMAARFEAEGRIWVRPLLEVTRAELRAMLKEQGLSWSDDPSNDDPRFSRARIRAAAPLLAELGLSVDRLGQAARALDRAASVVRGEVATLADRALTAEPLGYARLNAPAIGNAAEEVRLRLLAETLRWVAGADYVPRFDELEGLWAAMQTAGRRTLHGCLVERRGAEILIQREPARVGAPVPAGEIWDGRFQTLYKGDGPPPLVGALGSEAARGAGTHPASAIAATPGFRQNGALIAAPFGGPIAAPFASKANYCHSSLVTSPKALRARLAGR